MNTKFYGITILKLADLKAFLRVVDACDEPVYCLTANDCLCDLRSDKNRAEILVNMSFEGIIDRLELRLCSHRDVERMLNFMVSGKRTA